MITVVSKKGAIQIPAELLKKYELVEGSEVIIVDYGGVLSIVPALKDPIKQGRGILKGKSSLTKALLEERAKDLEYEEAKIKRLFHAE